MDAETLYGGKCLIQHSSLKIESVNNTIPHIFLIYRIILNGHGSETMHKVKGVPLEPNRGGKIPILTFTPIVTISGGFHCNARHVNDPESCTIG